MHTQNTQSCLEKSVVMEGFLKIREALMYDVLFVSGMDGFVKKFNFDRQARPLAKHDWLYE